MLFSSLDDTLLLLSRNGKCLLELEVIFKLFSHVPSPFHGFILDLLLLFLLLSFIFSSLCLIFSILFFRFSLIISLFTLGLFLSFGFGLLVLGVFFLILRNCFFDLFRI